MPQGTNNGFGLGLVNLGNVTGLIRSINAPAKTYVLWAQILNPSTPNLVRLHLYQDGAWVPLDSLTSSQFWLAPVLSQVNAPAAGPIAGQRYLVGTQPTGLFTGKANQVATYGASGYSYAVPAENAVLYIASRNALSIWKAGEWKSLGSTFAANFIVSTVNGAGLGKYAVGDLVPAAGKSAEEVLLDAYSQDVFPTYQPADLVLTQDVASVGELGATVNATLTAVFNRRDAGAATSLAIYRDGQLVGAVGDSSPLIRALSFVRTLAGTSFEALASYEAGSLKNISPSGEPDTRPADVRQSNAPQAAEVDLESNTLTDSGIYPWFFGTSATGNAIDVYGTGNKQVALSGGALNVSSFGLGQSYFWFAVPRTPDGNRQKLFTTWFRTALNQGSIGGASNLFSSPVVQSVTSVGLGQNWTHDYDVYVTNYAAEPNEPTTLN